MDACCGAAAVGIDATGLAVKAGNRIANYANASRRQRAAIAAIRGADTLEADRVTARLAALSADLKTLSSQLNVDIMAQPLVWRVSQVSLAPAPPPSARAPPSARVRPAASLRARSPGRDIGHRARGA